MRPALLAVLLAASYEAGILEWRKEHDRDLRSDKGPLFTVGRFDLPQGEVCVGSAPRCAVRLPQRGPDAIARLRRTGSNVTLIPLPGARLTVNGKPVSREVPLKPTVPGTRGDIVAAGDFSVSAVNVGGKWVAAVRDKQSPYLRDFKGSTWFPVQAKYRVKARFTAYHPPKKIPVPDTTGGTRDYEAPGYLAFRLDGQELRLNPIASGGELFIMFRDRTSGRETYGAGRFVEANQPVNGETEIDFNKAYNPYCAHNPYTSCPVPPKQNRLPVEIRAGETYAGHDTAGPSGGSLQHAR